MNDMELFKFTFFISVLAHLYTNYSLITKLEAKFTKLIFNKMWMLFWEKVTFTILHLADISATCASRYVFPGN